MKVVEPLIQILTVAWKAVYFLAGIILIFAVAYIFGYIVLYSPMGGNDAAFALSYATWINHYFPNLPFLYTLQGAGVSMVAGYPQFFSIVSVLAHKISGLTLIQSFGLIQFSTLILTSFGIYLFVWSRFRNQTMALIASFLYFLSPMTYVWIIGAGFYAQTFSFIFVPYALLFFDLYLDSSLDGEEGLRKRLYLVGSVTFICLAT